MSDIVMNFILIIASIVSPSSFRYDFGMIIKNILEEWWKMLCVIIDGMKIIDSDWPKHKREGKVAIISSEWKNKQL